MYLGSSNDRCYALQILVTSTNMSSNQALIEMRGKYLLATGDRKNVPSPGQHVFFYSMQHEGIEIIIDCKTYGNDARFVRRSCKPNAVVRFVTLTLYFILNYILISIRIFHPGESRNSKISWSVICFSQSISCYNLGLHQHYKSLASESWFYNLTLGSIRDQCTCMDCTTLISIGEY